jgi:hypothetical protein
MPYKRSSGVSEPRSQGKSKGLRGPDKQQDERRVQRPARAKQRKRRTKIKGVS